MNNKTPQVPEFAASYPLLMQSTLRDTEIQKLDENGQMFIGNLQVYLFSIAIFSKINLCA